MNSLIATALVLSPTRIHRNNPPRVDLAYGGRAWGELNTRLTGWFLDFHWVAGGNKILTRSEEVFFSGALPCADIVNVALCHHCTEPVSVDFQNICVGRAEKLIQLGSIGWPRVLPRRI